MNNEDDVPWGPHSKLRSRNVGLNKSNILGTIETLDGVDASARRLLIMRRPNEACNACGITIKCEEQNCLVYDSLWGGREQCLK